MSWKIDCYVANKDKFVFYKEIWFFDKTILTSQKICWYHGATIPIKGRLFGI